MRTIYTNGGSESDAFRAANYGPMNCHLHKAVWSGYLDANDDLVYDDDPTQVGKFLQHHGLSADTDAVIHLDFEHSWTTMKRAGPTHLEWASMAAEYAKAVVAWKAALPNTRICGYDVPMFDKWNADDTLWRANNLPLCEILKTAGVDLLLVTCYISKRYNNLESMWETTLNRVKAMADEVGLPLMLHWSNRYAPRSNAPGCEIMPDDIVTWQAQLTASLDAEYSTWEAAPWYVKEAFARKSGAYKRNSSMWQQTRTAYRAELTAVGIDTTDFEVEDWAEVPVATRLALQTHWHTVKGAYYVKVNDALGNSTVPPPVGVPISEIQMIRDAMDPVIAHAADLTRQAMTNQVQIQGIADDLQDLIDEADG